MIDWQGTLFSLILSPDINRDFRVFCLLTIRFVFMTIGKKIRSNTMPCHNEFIHNRILFYHVLSL
jgi:hypothetical protein